MYSAVCLATGLPRDRLKVVHQGQSIQNEQHLVGIKNGGTSIQMAHTLMSCSGVYPTPFVPTADTVMAIAVPRPPAVTAVRDETATEDTGPWLQLDSSAPQWQQRVVAAALRRGVPTWPLLLVLCFPRFWLALVLWCIGARLTARADLGPIYILGTIITLIAINLGRRTAGQPSAYSIFNNFQRMPGQLTAEDLDQQLRHGQM